MNKTKSKNEKRIKKYPAQETIISDSSQTPKPNLFSAAALPIPFLNKIGNALLSIHLFVQRRIHILQWECT